MAMAAAVQPSPPIILTTASLYVGDLDPSVQESHLVERFSGLGDLVSVRLCRDKDTGKSLCYGYVNFLYRESAESAMITMNGKELNGKTIRIMWSQRNPEARKSGIGNLFIKNLDLSIDHNGLTEMFNKFGKIVSCKVALTEDGKPNKGFGFVQFESEEDAMKAIDELNGKTIDGKKLYVGKFMKRSERSGGNSESEYRNLYVKNLDPEVVKDDDDFLKMFSEFGKVESAVIVKDEKGISKEFGFVCYKSSEDAKKAIAALHDSELGSKKMYVARALKKAEREQVLKAERKAKFLKSQGSVVYVKNIDDSVTKDELIQYFSTAGKIVTVKVMCDDKKRSKGFGYVCFSNPDEATKAVNMFNSKMFGGKLLYVSIAQLKEVRRAQLQSQHALRIRNFMTAAFPTFNANINAEANQPPRYTILQREEPMSNWEKFDALQQHFFDGCLNHPAIQNYHLSQTKEYDNAVLRSLVRVPKSVPVMLPEQQCLLKPNATVRDLGGSKSGHVTPRSSENKIKTRGELSYHVKCSGLSNRLAGASYDEEKHILRDPAVLLAKVKEGIMS